MNKFMYWLVAGIGALLALLRLKNNKIAELQATAAAAKHEAAIAASSVKLREAQQSYQEARDAFNRWSDDNSNK